MPQAVQSVGNFASGPTGSGLLAGAGAASNIAGSVSDFIQQKKYNDAQNYVRNLMTNPAAFTAAEQSYIKPLNKGLITSVTNQTNAQLASRGLGGSSAITQATLAQALAPYIMQNQQEGQSALMQSLGLLGGTKPTGTSGFTDISKLLAQLRAAAPAGGPTTPAYNTGGTDPLGLLNPGAPPTPDLAGLGSSVPTNFNLSQFLNPAAQVQPPIPYALPQAA